MRSQILSSATDRPRLPLLLALVVLTVLFFCFRHALQSIPVDVSTRTNATLSKLTATDVSTSVNGRDITLLGNVSSETLKASVIKAVTNTRGVNSVVDKLTLVKLEPGHFLLKRNKKGFSFRATVGSEQQKTSIVSQVASTFGENTVAVAEQVSVGEETDWLEGVTPMLSTLGILDKFEVSIGNGSLNITGLAKNDAERNRITNSLSHSSFTNLKISEEILVPAELYLSHQDNVAVLKGKLPDQSEIRSQILNLPADSSGVVFAEHYQKNDWIENAIELVRDWTASEETGLEFAGDRVTISGEVGSEDAKIQLENKVSELFADTHTIENQTRVSLSTTLKNENGELLITAMDETVAFGGSLSSREQIDALIARARKALPNRTLIHQLVPDARNGETIWLTESIQVVEALPEGTGFTLSASENSFELMAIVENPAQKSSLEQRVNRLVSNASKDIQISYDVVAYTAQQEKLRIERERLARAVAGLDLSNIRFELNTANIQSHSRPVLVQTAELLAKYPEIKIKIEGHTDSTGSEITNRQLSAARAESVKTFLVQQGVLAQRMKTIGLGSTRPVAPNTTFAGRKLNRRIEIIILDSNIGPE